MPFDPRTLQIGRLYTRPELARLWGYRGFQALARGVFTPKGGGHVVLFVTRQKQASLTQYHDFINGDRLHWEGEASHRSDDRVAHAHENGEVVHLFYRDVHHTPFRYHGPLAITDFRSRESAPSRFVFNVVHDMGPADDLAVHELELSDLPATERISITKARVGQGEFRDQLLGMWHGCAVTGIEAADLLRASHIQPWRFSSNADRLSPFNGLLLLPQYDHLFDRGYITFAPDGRLLASPALASLSPELLGVRMDARLRRVVRESLPYLEFHRDEVFLRREQSEASQ